MKFIKTAIVVALVALSASTYAKGEEEVCYNSARTDLELKQIFNARHNGLTRYLELLNSKSNIDPEIKANMRETAYWVYNRKNLSEDTFLRLAFFRCIATVN